MVELVFTHYVLIAVIVLGVVFLLLSHNGSVDSPCKDASDGIVCDVDGSKLSPEQYRITQKNGTERAFSNEYWDNHEEGIYVDVVSGKPLFSSTHKFDSGTGWPSFTCPLNDGEIKELEDDSLGVTRTEVRSMTADSHLGHLFNDGPQSEGGMRYCINSAALRFIPKAEMEKEGYGEYLSLFE